MRQATDNEERDETEHRGRESQREVLRQRAAMEVKRMLKAEQNYELAMKTNPLLLDAVKAVNEQAIGVVLVTESEFPCGVTATMVTSLRFLIYGRSGHIATLAELLDSMADELRRADKQGAKG